MGLTEPGGLLDGAGCSPLWMEENSRTQGQVYQLRIQLSGISPPIWRRILVAADCTIAELHQTIQLAMGWTDEHLHQFAIRSSQ